MEYGLIGNKLSHSISPLIHSYLESVPYELIELEENNLEAFLNNRNFKGINVTIPYKKAVIPYLDEIDEKAEKIGAVNTIVNRNGKLYGYNTDYDGFMFLLQNAKIDVTNKKILVLGNGGASNSVISVLKDLNAATIIKVNRTLSSGVISYDDAIMFHTDSHIIVNTTPVGMFPNTNACPIDVSSFNSLESVVDIIYNPAQTLLLKNALQKGIKCENGLSMLVAQAKSASDLFLNKKRPVELIYQVQDAMLNRL